MFTNVIYLIKSMASTVSRGNYYKTKTKKYFEKLGYDTQITEFMCGRPISKNKIIYVKRDVFGSDGISMNGTEIIFWNSKHTVTGNISNVKSEGKKEFEKYPFPKYIKCQLVIWQPKQKLPTIIDIVK